MGAQVYFMGTLSSYRRYLSISTDDMIDAASVPNNLFPLKPTGPLQLHKIKNPVAQVVRYLDNLDFCWLEDGIEHVRLDGQARTCFVINAVVNKTRYLRMGIEDGGGVAYLAVCPLRHALPSIRPVIQAPTSLLDQTKCRISSVGCACFRG